MVESACLENRYTGNGIRGSNPLASAYENSIPMWYAIFILGDRGFEPGVPIFLKRFALGKKWIISTEGRGESSRLRTAPEKQVSL